MNGVLITDTPKLLPFPYPKFFFFLYILCFLLITSKRISSDFELSKIIVLNLLISDKFFWINLFLKQTIISVMSL